MAEVDVRRILHAKNYYDILQVPKDVSEEDLKRAYKKLALLTHPDKNKTENAEEAFKAVGKAYTTLSDPQKRSVYDRHGEAGLQGTHVRTQRGGNYEPDDIYDLFAQMFGADTRGMHTRHYYYSTQRAQQGPRPGGPGGPNGEEFQGPPWAAKLAQILPICLFLIVFLLFSVGFEDQPPIYSLSFDQQGGYIRKRSTREHRIPYYVMPNFAQIHAKDPSSLYNIEASIYANYKNQLNRKCRYEQKEKIVMRNRASLYYSGKTQRDMLEKADAYPTPSCDEFTTLSSKYG